MRYNRIILTQLVFGIYLNLFSAFMSMALGNEQKIPVSNWRIVFSHPQGFYQERFQLELTNILQGANTYYTLDGSEPNINSTLYKQPILIPEHITSSNGITDIPTNPAESPDCWIWKPAQEPLSKGVVVRARAYIGHIPASKIYTQTYFIGISPASYKVPIISIVSDPMNLFDHDQGLYVPGATYENSPEWTDIWGSGNYHNRGDEWERPANITLFDKIGNASLHQDIGIRIHGGGSRSLPIKSLRIYARDSYETTYMQYPFFADQDFSNFRRIILRNSGQDFKTSYLNDALSHVLVSHLDLETQSYQPSIVFINGEYWGIHNIRDRIDKYYLEYRKGINPNAIDLLTGYADVEEGSNGHYLELLSIIHDHDIRLPHVYEKIGNYMEIENFIEYNIVKQFIAIEDWPGNNVDFWRPQTENGRWRWIFYDNDGAFFDDEQDFIAINTLEGGTEWPNPDWSTFLFRNLLKNEKFRTDYINRFAYHLEHTFETNRVLATIDSLAEGIRHLIPEHVQRWNYPQSLSFWESRIDRMKRFARLRPCVARSILIEYFNLEPDTFMPDLCIAYHHREEPTAVRKNSRSETSLNIFPNPANGDQLWVEYNGPGMGRSELELIDITGRSVLSVHKAFQHANNPVSLTVTGLPKGMYILVVRGPETLTSHPVILQ